MKSFSLCIAILIVMVSVVGITACQPTEPTAGGPATTTSTLEQKTGDTTKTGTITGAEGAYFLQVPGEAPLAVDSYSLNLSEYVGQSVTVTGQYSGNTLFIGSIK